MKFLMILLPLVIGVISHPDAYRYTRPQNNHFTNYLPPENSGKLTQAVQHFGNHFSSSSGFTHNQPPTNHHPSITHENLHYVPPNGHNAHFHQLPPNSHHQLTGGYIPPGNAYNHYEQSAGNYNGNDLTHSHPFGDHNSEDQKGVYFFAAPDEEPARLRIQIAPTSEKNNKIIFIKTPTYGNVIPQVIPAANQAEEKTFVYVLVKKPNQNDAITLPSSLGQKRVKPQVYFIKYRNQHDAERIVTEGLQGRSAGSSLPDLGSEVEFVKSIDNDAEKNARLEDLNGNGNHMDSPNFLNGNGSFNNNNNNNNHNNYGPPGVNGPY